MRSSQLCLSTLGWTPELCSQVALQEVERHVPGQLGDMGQSGAMFPDLWGISSALPLAREGLVSACCEWWASSQMLCSLYTSKQWFFTTRQDTASSHDWLTQASPLSQVVVPISHSLALDVGSTQSQSLLSCSSPLERVNKKCLFRKPAGPGSQNWAQIPAQTHREPPWVRSPSLPCLAWHSSASKSRNSVH